VSGIPPEALKVTDTTCDSSTENLTKTQCRDRYLKWLVGIDNGTAFTRCPLGQCDLMGDVYHSTPRVVPPPSELTRDDYKPQFISFRNWFCVALFERLALKGSPELTLVEMLPGPADMVSRDGQHYAWEAVIQWNAEV